jgi:pimeloyl-ACP methyl ester carboxylesterase
MTPFRAAPHLSTTLGGILVNLSMRFTSTRSPVPAIAASLFTGAALAITFLFTLARGGSEAVVTGSVMAAFGLGWGLMVLLTARFSAQPQPWMAVPAAFLGITGLGLLVVQPGAAVMDALGWLWPPALIAITIWMIAQVRRELRGRGRWLVVPVIATLLMFAIGGGIATVSAVAGPGAIPANGRLIDVGGHRLYIECTGSGGPTVVLQSGLAETSSYWARIASTVAASTTVCVYDRAGHGRSDEVGAQDGIAVAADLHTLLVRAGVAGPYVLVGHSSGGPYVRIFAATYPDEVAGMVLLDAQPADAFTALPAYPSEYQMLRLIYGLGTSLARIGILGPALGLPADESTVVAARGAHVELGILPTTLLEAQALTSLGSRPLVVVTALSGADTGWAEAQDRLVSLSTNAKHVVLASATHVSIISGDDSPVSSQAILDVVESIRTGTAFR